MSQYFYQKTINLLFNNNVWFCLPFQRQFRLFLARRLPRISFSFPFLHFPLSLIGIKTQFRSETRQARVFEGKLFSNSETIINSIPSIQDRCDAKRNSILGYSIGNVSNVGTRISMHRSSVPFRHLCRPFDSISGQGVHTRATVASVVAVSTP